MSVDVTGVGRDTLVRPIQTFSRKYVAVLLLVLAGIGVWLYFYVQQLQHGLIVTHLGDWGSGGGVPWGLYIGAFIWWVGIAHGGIILSAAAFRYADDWDELIPNPVFYGLSKWLGCFALLFLWLQLQQVITGVFAAPTTLQHATEVKLSAPIYWVAIGLVIAAELYIFASALKASLFTIPRIVAVSVLVLVGTLIEKTLFVVEGLQHAHFQLYDGVPGTYIPSPVELSSLLGAVSIVVLFFLAVSKVIPVVELHATEGDHEGVSE